MKKRKVTKAEITWWELFPRLTVGDRVRVIADGRVGRIISMAVPMSHTDTQRSKKEYYERVSYTVIFLSVGEKSIGRDYKRWEIEKVRKTN